jgi:carbonic anhydrase/acetyltransferase-like protein (isoleucine patch superfamily)
MKNKKEPQVVRSMNLSDFELLTKGRKSVAISTTNKTAGENQIFIEEGAKVEFSILNATEGPIYIGKDAEIMEGSHIRGPFALLNDATVKMGTKIYGGTTIGPHCKVGGEICNVVMFGYSNKAHDGYLGNAVIGTWCNIGAGTAASNLKNDYSEVKQWNYATQNYQKTGLQFCGLMMGDHSKCGINVSFNTGTVLGICCNIYDSNFQALHQKNRASAEPLIAKLHTEKAKLHELKAKNACAAKIEEQRLNVKEARKALRAHMKQGRKEFEAILSKDQLCKFKELRKEKKAEFAKCHKHHGECCPEDGPKEPCAPCKDEPAPKCPCGK